MARQGAATLARFHKIPRRISGKKQDKISSKIHDLYETALRSDFETYRYDRNMLVLNNMTNLTSRQTVSSTLKSIDRFCLQTKNRIASLGHPNKPNISLGLK